jgi:2-amino-4-hydroxy-6-hydroxymethyldihydropteridine diphosphokinase
MLSANQLCLQGMSVRQTQRMTLLALGSNQASTYGSSASVLNYALDVLKSRGLHPIAISHYYVSEPFGAVRQPPYVNAVVAVECAEPVGTLLRKIKRIERDMGRRAGVRWGPRVLDIDIVSHRSQYAAGQSLGWVDKHGRATIWRRGQLALPHPEAHRRSFVLQPICDIMPQWHHPVINASAKQILKRLPPRRQSRLRRLVLADANFVCEGQ